MCSDAAIDPEQEYDDAPSEDDEDSHEEPDVREHYVDVGPSAMRRKARLTESDALEKPTYKGVRASRAEMFGSNDADGLDEADEDFEDSEENGEDAEDASEEDKNDADDLDGENHDATSEGEDVEDEAASDDAGLVTPSLRSTKHATQGAPEDIAVQEAESHHLLSDLYERRKLDAQKGRHVQKQIKMWEQALRMRISLQKVITNTARLPGPGHLKKLLADAPSVHEELDRVAADLEDLAAKLLDVRMQLWSANFGSLTKELDSRVNREASSSKALNDLESFIEPHRRMLLRRWSNKIAAAPDPRGAGASARLQLRAMNQGVVEQIDQALAGDGLQRLVERTRVWRSPDVSRMGADAAEETETRPTDVEVFDDSDFYSQLLRDLIDNANLVDARTSVHASSALQSRKRKRNVDPRASKGRKIRYEVMDKVQNFMPPIPRTTWDDAQIDRLFTRLASATPKAPHTIDSEAKTPTDTVPVDDGFRLFG